MQIGTQHFRAPAAIRCHLAQLMVFRADGSVAAPREFGENSRQPGAACGMQRSDGYKPPPLLRTLPAHIEFVASVLAPVRQTGSGMQLHAVQTPSPGRSTATADFLGSCLIPWTVQQLRQADWLTGPAELVFVEAPCGQNGLDCRRT